jgi:hypothetical protein
MKGLLKTKTFWASLAGIFGAIGGYVAGEVNLSTMLIMAVGFLVAMFIRDSIVKA